MKFKPFHRLFFNSKDGAFSKVTKREYHDSQITLTDLETDIIINYFGRENIHKGNVGSNKKKALKQFVLYNTGETISLNLVFPKPEKTELRLYLSKRSGFKPLPEMYWFIFLNENQDIVIGALEDFKWEKLGQIDDDDDGYISEINSIWTPEVEIDSNFSNEIITQTIGERVVYRRNPKLAILRFKMADFRCEIDSSHQTFISQSTKLPFVEAHHFVPMKFQNLYTDYSLDNLENIVSLCPNCHRGFHHAIIDEKLELISNIYKKRPQLNRFSFEDVAGFYNCFKL